MIGGTVDGDRLRFAGVDIPVPRSFRPTGSAIGHDVIVGIRPEGFADASLIGDRPTLGVTVDVVEDLGADLHVLFTLDVPAVRTDGVNTAQDTDEQLNLDGRSVFTARLDSRTRARAGEHLTLAIDPEQVYLFDPGSGESLLAA
jgi:multiple sugar transport system ATP-binding protein